MRIFGYNCARIKKLLADCASNVYFKRTICQLSYFSFTINELIQFSPINTMDQIDKSILRHLQANARMSNAELAERVNLSPTPCLRRVKRLERSGVIRGYAAELDLKKVGLTISALVFVQLTINSTDNAAKFEAAIKSIRRVQECSVLTGSYDYLLQVVAIDLADYEKLIKGELANIANIKNLESTIVLNQVAVNFSPPFVSS